MDWEAFWGETLPDALATFGARALSVAIIVLGAMLLAWVLRMLIRRTVERVVTGAKRKQNVEDTQALLASPLALVRIVQRTRTLGTVLSNIVNTAIVVVAVILVIQTLWPGVLGSFALLTAAIGAGLGFGAQNIVKDVLNGLFMVVEDQLGVGDVVNLGSVAGEITGVVEVVGIRITQVRDVNGTLWFVRNGEITRVGNMSQGWARVVIDIAAPYEAAIDELQESLLKCANRLAGESRWRPLIIGSPELWGIQSVSDAAIVLRLVVKTRSAAKDSVARELRARFKAVADELNITLPSLEAVVLSGTDSAMSINGARPPRTRPVPLAAPVEKKRHGRKPRTKEDK